MSEHGFHEDVCEFFLGGVPWSCFSSQITGDRRQFEQQSESSEPDRFGEQILLVPGESIVESSIKMFWEALANVPEGVWQHTTTN